MYWFLLVAIGLVVGFAYLYASRQSRKALWLTAIVLGASLILIGWLDWGRQDSAETPLHAYLLTALVPTFLVAALIDVIGEKLRPPTRVLVASSGWLIL